jgi:pimeloyl-ACP methyl ester carboxylesterase
MLKRNPTPLRLTSTDMSAVPASPAPELHGENLMAIGSGSLALRVIIHRTDISDRRPLVVINSVDYPMPPSEDFCERMWSAGYQVIFVERPGFGSSRGLPKELAKDYHIRSGAAVSTEAALILTLTRQLKLQDIVLLGMGSANPVCYRLARLCPEIELSVFSNAMFNQNIWGVFRPKWFQSMLRQTVSSKPGLYFATYGIKHQMRKAPLSFYRQLLQKSPGDLKYFEDNKSDFVKGSRLFRKIEAATFNYDLKMSLTHDQTLHDRFFEDVNAVILSGQETTELWQSELHKEADRLDLPVEYAPSGDLYAPYVSPDAFLNTIDRHSKSSRRKATV